MGLDMYVNITTERFDTDVDFTPTIECTELHYWRKHPNLHGWMEQRYRLKCGTNEIFNCCTLKLTPLDLDELEAAVRNGNLPQTRGFFFGETLGDEIPDDLEFIRKARGALGNGFTVFYDSWW